MEKIGRNDPCPCGSGRKYKKCCLDAPMQGPIQEFPNHKKNPNNMSVLTSIMAIADAEGRKVFK